MSGSPRDSEVQQVPASWTAYDKEKTSIRTRNLRSSQNFVPYISKLPTEMLVAVFTDILMSAQPPDSCSLLHVTQVCRHWRRVATDNPLLWTQVDMTSACLRMVAWSKQAPLVVRFEEDEEWELPTFARDFIPGNIHRIQDLVVDVLPNVVEPIVGLLDRPAPLLQAATIRYYGKQHDLVLRGLSKLLGGNAPKLQRLCLGGMLVDWDWPVFSHLVELELDGIEPQPSVLSLFRKMPQLQVFESTMAITDCLDSCSGTISNSKIVHLRSLRRLVLWNSSFRRLSSLLHHIQIPPTSYINLFILPGGDDFVTDYSPLFQPCKELRVEVEEGAVHFTTSTITVQVVVSHPLTDCLVAGLHAFAVPSGLHSLALNMNSHELKMGWPSMFHQIRHIEHLDLQYDNTSRSLIQALTNSEPPPESLPLSKLRYLMLRVKGHPKVVSDAFKVLSRLLHERSRQGVRMAVVDVLVDWYGIEGLTPEGLHKLRGVADFIRWENKVIERSSTTVSDTPPQCRGLGHRSSR